MDFEKERQLQDLDAESKLCARPTYKSFVDLEEDTSLQSDVQGKYKILCSFLGKTRPYT